LPQGLPKKIEFNLLLTNLALELGNPLPRRGKLAGRLRAGLFHTWRKLWRAPRFPSESSRAFLTIRILPAIQHGPRDPYLAGEGRNILAPQHALHCLNLHPTLEHAVLLLGHQLSSRELSPI
jgi:hypothetical protein